VANLDPALLVAVLDRGYAIDNTEETEDGELGSFPKSVTEERTVLVCEAAVPCGEPNVFRARLASSRVFQVGESPENGGVARLSFQRT
jgi:hypothetical protein